MKLLKLLEQVIQELGESPFKLTQTPDKKNIERLIQKGIDSRNLRDSGKLPKETGVLAGKSIYKTVGNSGQEYEIIIILYITKDRNNNYTCTIRVDFDVAKNKGKEVLDTNLKEQFNLLSTVIKATKDLVTKAETKAKVTVIQISAKEDGTSQQNSLDSKRGRIYGNYIKQNIKDLPGQWDLFQTKDTYILSRQFENTLQETGDNIDKTNVKTYDTTEKKRDTVHKYAEVNAVYFNTESKTRYYIMFDKTDDEHNNNWTMTVSFAAKTSGNTKFDVNAVVNKGELYRVMATVIKAIKEELEESEKKGQNIFTIKIQPSKNFETDSRRAKLYMAYIQNNMPKGARIEKNSDMSNIEIDLSPSYLL